MDAPESRRRSALSRADNPLVRGIARVRAPVHRKLLAAIVGIVSLLVVLGVLGLRVLGASNDRVGTLGSLQVRTASYQELQTSADQVRVLLGLRAGGEDWGVFNPDVKTERGNVTAVDSTIDSTLARFGPAIQAAEGVSPSPDERNLLAEIKRQYVLLADVMTRMLAFDRANDTAAGLQLQHEAEPVANSLLSLTGRLVNATKRDTERLIASNASSFSSSRNLFIAVAAGSVVLALGLGFVLSWSLIGPIRRMGTRLEAIAAGDFSGHVDVANRDELGDLARNLNQMNDELGRVYAELETVSRHKSEFLASMSHELRTPLNAIIGFSEVLSERMFGELNERQAEYVNDILGAGRHLHSLINDILDLSKVEAGKMDLDLVPVSIHEALSSGVTMHRDGATRRRIELSLDVEPDMQPITADERKVRQVVFNLLSNAVKLTPEGGRIIVSAHTIDGFVEISVADTGPGIPPEDVERIFEEFQQVKGTAEGTGLGLPLARRFVELHGGRLWVTSRQGEGSTFTFTLPARPSVPAS